MRKIRSLRKLILHSCVLTLPSFIVSGIAVADEPQAESSRYDRAILLTLKEDDRDQYLPPSFFCSGFLVETQASLYIVTARHAAVLSSSQSKVRIAISPDDVAWMELGELSDWQSANPWVHNEVTDISLLKIAFDSESESHKFAKRAAISIDDLMESSPRRNSLVDVVGYPSVVRVSRNGPLSASVFRTSVASREMPLQAGFKMPPTSFLISPPVPDGMSGAPVFAHSDDELESQCVGIFTAFLTDRSGPKAGVIVPAYYIKKLITTIDATPGAVGGDDRGD